MAAAVRELGFERFSVAGHDRGGRAGYRLALDHPDRVDRLALLDVVATADAWERADKRFATGFWPWSLLAQPEPLPERLLTTAPDAVIDAALGGWGAPAATFGADARAAYIEMLRDRVRVHATCEEYRAAATCDDEHVAEDRRLGRRIGCPVLVLWSSAGPPGHLVRWGRRPARALAALGGRCERQSTRRRPLLSGRRAAADGGATGAVLRQRRLTATCPARRNSVGIAASRLCGYAAASIVSFTHFF